MAGHVAIITGGAQGIGLACVRRFIKDGFRVVVADSDERAAKNSVDAIISEVPAAASRLVAVHCDVSEKLSVHNLIAETLASFGEIDVLINNAGIALKGGLLDLKLADFDRVMDVNLRGAFLVSQAVAKHMVARVQDSDDRSGLTNPQFSIINISSVSAQVAMANYLAYSVSKSGLNQLTRNMAVELAPQGIRVNSIGPGSISTDMLSQTIGSADSASIAARTPLGRAGQPSEIAGVAAFLAGPDASYITGECLYVDGGRLSLNYNMPIPDEG